MPLLVTAAMRRLQTDKPHFCVVWMPAPLTICGQLPVCAKQYVQAVKRWGSQLVYHYEEHSQHIVVFGCALLLCNGRRLSCR